MKKLNYEKLGNTILISLILFFAYYIFSNMGNYFANFNKDEQEFEYIQTLNKDFSTNKTIIQPVENFFNRNLIIKDSVLSLNYNIVDSENCVNFIKNIHQNYNTWTSVNIKTPTYEKTIYSDELYKAYDLICQKELNITFILDKEDKSYAQKLLKRKEEKEEKEKEKIVFDNNTKELEHILINLANFNNNNSYLHSPYNLFKSEIHYDKEINQLTTTYVDMNYNFCERSINIFKNNKADEFHRRNIIYFEEDNTNLVINEVDLNKLKEYTIPYVCKENNKISFIFYKEIETQPEKK